MDLEIKMKDYTFRKYCVNCLSYWTEKVCEWFKKVWNWHINLIRAYPVWCAYLAWCEGIIIGILVVLLWL
jgi:hypothetical protein